MNFKVLMSLSEHIELSLNAIQCCLSTKEMLPVFKEFTIKLLQFSSIIQETKKGFRNDQERKIVALLLKSLKRDMVTLSNLSQACMKEKQNFKLKRQQDEVIMRIKYSLSEALKIVKKYNKVSSKHRNTKADNGIQSMKDSLQTLSLADTQTSSSEDHSVCETESASEFQFYNEADTKRKKEVTKKGSFIIEQVKSLIDRAVTKKRANSGPMLTISNITAGCSSQTQATVTNLKDTARDLASVAISYSQNNINADEEGREKDAYVLSKLGVALENMVKDICEELKDDLVNVTGSTLCDERFLRRSIRELKKLSAEGNVIDVVDANSTFIDVVRKEEKALKASLSKTRPATAEETNAVQAIKRALLEFDKTSNDVIMDMENMEFIRSHEQNMVNVFECIKTLKLLVDEKNENDKCTPSKAELAKQENYPDKVSESSEAISGTDQDLHDSSFAGQLLSFTAAIKNGDYRTVERLANGLMDDLKKTGNILQKTNSRLTQKSNSRLSHLRESYESCLRLAGSCCSHARKAALADDWEESVDVLKTTGIQFAMKMNHFVTCCKKILRPWIDISLSNVSEDEVSATKMKMVHALAELTMRTNKVIETLSFTEYFEHHKLKEGAMNLQKALSDAASFISLHSKDSYPLKTSCIQWSCAMFNMIALFDELINKHKLRTIKKASEIDVEEIEAWIAMLSDLAFLCSDDETRQEISDRIGDLQQFMQRLDSLQDSRDDREISIRQTDKILLKREVSCKVLLIAELIEVLTREVSEPMRTFIEPLASLSFASSLACCGEIRDAFVAKMDTVETMACLAVEDSPSKAQSHLAFQAVDQLKSISEKLLSLVSMPRSECNQSVEMLQLQWRAKAVYLERVLMSVPEVKFTAVAGVLRHLQSASHFGHLDELLDILKDEGSPLNPYTPKGLHDSTFIEHISYYRGDDLRLDEDSVLSSAVDYPLSRDTDLISDSSPRIESAEANFFKQFEDGLKEEDESENVLQPLSSSSISTRSCSSQTQDTEIFIEKQRRAFPAARDAAAEILRREVEKWEEEGNSIITVVKQMSNQMLHMADYARGKGNLRSKVDFINTAKAIAANAKMIAKFAIIIADHCLDETCQANLMHYAELVPTISTQLKIIASVKAATPDDETADAMLIGNAENLMRYVLATLRAIEAASVKFKKDGDDSTSNKTFQSKSAALTLQWKRKRDWQRAMEAYNAPTNDLGLKISANSPVLSIADL
eukprot:gene5175-5827_t